MDVIQAYISCEMLKATALCSIYTVLHLLVILATIGLVVFLIVLHRHQHHQK